MLPPFRRTLQPFPQFGYLVSFDVGRLLKSPLKSKRFPKLNYDFDQLCFPFHPPSNHRPPTPCSTHHIERSHDAGRGGRFLVFIGWFGVWCRFFLGMVRGLLFWVIVVKNRNYRRLWSTPNFPSHCWQTSSLSVNAQLQIRHSCLLYERFHFFMAFNPSIKNSCGLLGESRMGL